MKWITTVKTPNGDNISIRNIESRCCHNSELLLLRKTSLYRTASYNSIYLFIYQLRHILTTYTKKNNNNDKQWKQRATTDASYSEPPNLSIGYFKFQRNPPIMKHAGKNMSGTKTRCLIFISRKIRQIVQLEG
jgi:hypothetical protein